MKRILKPTLTIVIVVVLLTLITSAVVYAISDNFMLGELFKRNSSEKRLEMVASYKGQIITVADLEMEMGLNELLPESENKSELDSLNSLILKLVLLSEAEKLGLQAAPDEITEFVSGQKQFYEDVPEIAATVDDYCAGADMTLEEYWIDLAERAPRVITRNKVRNSFFAEYFEENNLEHGQFISQEDQERIEAAYDEYCRQLLEQNKNDIVYSTEIDTTTKN